MKSEEAKIQHDIVMLLQDRGVFCHSVPNEAQGRSVVAQMQMVAMGLRKGVADLVVWWPVSPGSSVCIPGYMEVKTPAGRQSPEQVKFEMRCHAAGMRYDLVRSANDAQVLLDKMW